MTEQRDRDEQLPVEADVEQLAMEADVEQLAMEADVEQLATVSAGERAGVLVVTVRGEIDITNIERVADVIDAQPNPVEGMAIDLSRVSYLDSSAVSLLHDLAMRLRGRAQPLAVVSPAGTPPRRVLELTALDATALVVDSLERAVSLLRGDGRP